MQVSSAKPKLLLWASAASGERRKREPDHGKEELFVASEMPEDAKIILRRGIIGRNLSLPRTIFAFFLHGILNCINFVVELLSSMLGTHILTNMQTNKPKD